MKLRSLYLLSIIGLCLVVLIQLGGMVYAYNNYKNEARRTLNECFRQAFIETVDNQINNLLGFGLGLNYVQQVMLAHGGRVGVKSEEGRYSEFTLYFPPKP